MKVLITGAAGYIGSKLTSKLLNAGHQVFAFDNYFYDQYHVSRVFDKSNCFHYNEDITEWSFKLKNAVANADFIFPLAALVGAPLCDRHPELTIKLNQEWFRTLLEYVSGTQKVIYPNTNSGYGSTGEAICTEETPCNPISLYGKTKGEAEKILLNNYDNSVCFRLATVYGRSYRQRMDLLVNNLVYNAMKDRHLEVFDGHFRRNYIHVDDIVGAFIYTMNNYDSMKNNVYNLGNDAVNMTKLDLVKKICEHTGISYSMIKDRTDPDKRDYIVSSKKLYDTGFSPHYDLDYGIREMMNVYVESSERFKDPEYMKKCRNY
jgi:nucleoside-diphosphate-sugar epimerase